MTKSAFWSVRSLLAAAAVCLYAGPLQSQSGEPKIEQFFAAATIQSKCPNDTTCVYVQTFPTGDSRQITVSVSPNRKYIPAARVTPGKAPISGFKYTSDFESDPVRINMSYYVAASGLPKGPVKRAQVFSPAAEKRSGNQMVRFVSLSPNDMPRNEWTRTYRVTQAGGGAGIQWTEIGKKGTDAAIGAAIDLGKDKGLKLGPLGSIYALASALSDVSAAADLGKQNQNWLKELDALEKCAANPTNNLARKEANYSDRTVAMIDKARGELKEVNSVRFLNQMTEKAADLTPVTAVMAVGLKQGFAWSEQTLNDYSQNTIMREVKEAVVKCENPTDASGNFTLESECTQGKMHSVTKIVGNVSWAWQMGVKYLPRGYYKYTEKKTNGPSCVETSTAEGTLDNTGYLFVFPDSRAKELGYGYQARFVNLPAQVTTTTNCGISSVHPIDIDWIPEMKGNRGTGGTLSGEAPAPACLSGQPSTVKWSFSVTAPKK